MRFVVELSGEHSTLPQAELEAVLALDGPDSRIVEVDGLVAIVEASDPKFLAKRLALSHTILEQWWSGPTNHLAAALAGREAGGTFAVRPRRTEGAQPDVVASDLAREVGTGILGKVDLKNPEVDVRILLGPERAHAGRLVAEVDRKGYEARHVKHRSHFAPVSLHPRYARTLVNLARVKKDDLVADPFVGTGGLVIEAALVGARVVAGDLDARMAAGTRMELDRIGATTARVETRDVGDLPALLGEPADAILSDPPYGRSSTTNREAMDALYDRFFEAAHAALKPGGTLAVIFPSEKLRAKGAETFRLVQSHDQKVHRSMTRHWAIFRRE